MGQESGVPQRISVSLDVLRTEIRLANAELELRLMDKLVQKGDLAVLAVRIEKLEASEREYLTLLPLREALIREHSEMRGDIERLEADKIGQEAVAQFKNRIIGGSVVAAVVFAINLGINFYQLFTGSG